MPRRGLRACDAQKEGTPGVPVCNRLILLKVGRSTSGRTSPHAHLTNGNRFPEAYSTIKTPLTIWPMAQPYLSLPAFVGVNSTVTGSFNGSFFSMS